MSFNQPYRDHIAGAMRKNSVKLADYWLKDLENVVLEDQRDVFPTDQYLDHIPSMIDEIASILEQPSKKTAYANSVIDRKAIQLGTLRHQQKASVSQLLREYELLSQLLDRFIAEQTDQFEGQIETQDVFDIMSSTAQIVRSILHSTVESFVEKYMGTIQEQTERILSFNRFVSHELKTPLQSALLNMELMMEGRDISQETTHELLRVQTSVQQASLLLRNIETLTENTDTVIDDNPVQQELQVTAIVRDVESQLAEAAQDKSVSIKVADDLGTISIDPAKFKLILTNLLTNAIKYSDPAKRERFVKIEPSASDNTDADSLQFTIHDNGLGIDPDMQSDVFKLRVRAHSEKDDAHDVSGHGLGLYLVSEAIEDLSGTIALESELGQGTTITLSFPLNAK